MSVLRVGLAVVFSSVLAAGCSSSSGGGGSEPAESYTKLDGGGTISLAEAAVTAYGDVALANASAVSCSSANGAAAALVITQLSTGATATIAGAAALGKVSIVGGDGTSRAGDGD